MVGFYKGQTNQNQMGILQQRVGERFSIKPTFGDNNNHKGSDTQTTPQVTPKVTCALKNLEAPYYNL